MLFSRQEKIGLETPRVLIVAGSDSGGGAGIQADIKAVTASGGYAATAITALTAQNTTGVYGIHPVPADFVKQQMEVVLEDIGADVIKLGMLHHVSVVEAVADVLTKYPDIPVVLDPVMISTSGSRLLESDAVAALQELLLPKAYVVTPNIPEAHVLLESGKNMSLPEVSLETTATDILERYNCGAVFLKGGHQEGAFAVDVLCYEGICIPISYPKIETTHTHGTGCTLASVLAVWIAKGVKLEEAAKRAKEFVYQGMIHAPGFGSGHGPLGVVI